MTRNWDNQNPNPALKTKTRITETTNSLNTKRSYGQPSEQLISNRSSAFLALYRLIEILTLGPYTNYQQVTYIFLKQFLKN